MENTFLSTSETSIQAVKEISVSNAYEPLIDISLDYFVFDSLKEFFDDINNMRDFKLLINNYLKETEQKLEELEDSINLEDFEGLIQIAHGIKGISATLGVMRLSRLCSELEKLARSQSINKLYPMFTEIKQEFSYIQNLLLRNLAKYVH